MSSPDQRWCCAFSQQSQDDDGLPIVRRIDQAEPNGQLSLIGPGPPLRPSLSEKIVEKMVEECANAKGKETGGILAGYYTPALDRAIVTELTGPPQDSVQSCWTFYRGVHGLHAWFMRLWRDKRHYYLGEWHFHPGGSPVPSLTDNRRRWLR